MHEKELQRLLDLTSMRAAVRANVPKSKPKSKLFYPRGMETKKTPVIEPATQMTGTATLEHCAILHSASLFANLFIVAVDFPVLDQLSYHLMRNVGDYGRGMAYTEPLTGDVTILSSTDDIEYTKGVRDREMESLQKQGHQFWSEYDASAGNRVPTMLLTKLGLRAYDPQVRQCANELKTVTDVVTQITKNATRELSRHTKPIYSGKTMVTGPHSPSRALDDGDYALASVLALRRTLMTLLDDIDSVQANAHGQLEALDHLLGQALRDE